VDCKSNIKGKELSTFALGIETDDPFLSSVGVENNISIVSF